MGIAHTRGASGEHLAAAYLELIGCAIEARNARLAGVEVDLIARDDDTLAIVEVKVRGRRDFGGAAQAVRPVQQQRLRRAAAALGAGGAPVRIDVIAIEVDDGGASVRHYRNAVTS